MIEHRGTLISEELFEKRFVCDLAACKGACCEQGDSGAPITPQEAAGISRHYDAIAPYMTARGRKGVEQHVEIKLWPKEQMALQASARALKETLAKVKA